MIGLYDVQYFLEKWKPKILLFRRDENNKKIIQEINDFLPYIYIEDKDKLLLVSQFERDIVKIEATNKVYILDKTRRLLKITLKHPLSIYKIKEQIKCYEADILFTNKYVIDNIDKLESSNYRVNYLDIETTSIEGFPTYLNPVENIISLACYDNYLDKSFLWIYHEKYREEIIQEKVDEGKLEIRRFNKEKDMLNNYLDFMVETKPDYVVSWNVNFDINYLCARLEFLKLKWEKLSPLYNTIYEKTFYGGIIKWGKGGGVFGKRFGIADREKHIMIVGLQYFDLLVSYKNITSKEQESFKLDYIAKKELGITKLQTHFDIGKKWKEEPEFIEKYNYMDVFLIKKLDDKMKIVNRYNNIKNASFLYSITDVFSSSRVLDNYILKMNKDKFIFPSKTYEENIDTRIAGGLVRNPIPKLYDNVAVFDFSGFYPNLMKTFNLSGEKLINEEIIFFDPEVDEDTNVDSILPDKMYEYDENKKEIIYRIKTRKFMANLTYKLDELGVMPQAVKGLIDLRNNYKTEMKKFKYGTLEYEQLFNLQFSMKFLINASYGVNSFIGFRLFKLHNANAITAFARMLSKWVGYKLEQKGWGILYSDTDSLFVQLHTNSLQDNLNENKEIEIIIKEAIDEFAIKYLPKEFSEQHTLKMDCEKIYSKLLLLDVKKKYIGLLKYFDGQETNKLNFMGLDAKKSNTIQLCKEAQLKLAEAILKEENIDSILEKYYQLIKSSDDIDLFKIPSKLERPQDKYVSKTPAVRASLWSNKHLKTFFRAGTKFYIVWVKEMNDTNVIAFESKEQLTDLKFSLDKEKIITDLYNKFDNLVRGLPDLKKKNDLFYLKYKHNNKLLSEYF